MASTENKMPGSKSQREHNTPDAPTLYFYRGERALAALQKAEGSTITERSIVTTYPSNSALCHSWQLWFREEP